MVYMLACVAGLCHSLRLILLFGVKFTASFTERQLTCPHCAALLEVGVIIYDGDSGVQGETCTPQ